MILRINKLFSLSPKQKGKLTSYLISLICSVKLGVKPQIIALPLHYRHFGWKDAWLLFHFGGSIGCLLKASRKIIKKLTQLFADWWNCRETFSRKLSWFKDQRFDQFPPSPQPLALRLNLGSFEFSSGENLFIASCLWVNKNLIYTDISSVYIVYTYRCICFQKGNSSYASLFNHNSFTFLRRQSKHPWNPSPTT